jgi:hypothetical protein
MILIPGACEQICAHDGGQFNGLPCREIETLKDRYESKLAVERKLAVTLKGENGLMRKRFTGLEKSIDEQKIEIRRLHEAQETLYTTIATHEKDIQAYKEVCRQHMPCLFAMHGCNKFCTVQLLSPSWRFAFIPR